MHICSTRSLHRGDGAHERGQVAEVDDRVVEARVAQLTKTVPVGRLGTGDDLGPAVVWLASNEASFVTGQTVHVNGGGITS